MRISARTTILASLRLCPEAWLGDYPADIQERFGPMGPTAQRVKWIVGIPMLLAPLVFAAALLADAHELTAGTLPYWHATLAVFVISPVPVARMHVSPASCLPHQISPPFVIYTRLSWNMGMLLILLGLTLRLRTY